MQFEYSVRIDVGVEQRRQSAPVFQIQPLPQPMLLQATSDVISSGRRGELATNSREQQEITLLSLQLLQNCLMLVNTILVERTLEKYGLWERLNEEDRRALTPLFHTHINPYGLFELDLESPSFLIAA